MKVTALGHAGLMVETARATVLIDPWFSPEGAFQASWFQFPDNSHLIAPSLFQPTAIVISHEHLDHIDPWFLSKVPSSVPVVITRYPSPVLRQKIELAGPRRIIEVPPWERVDLAENMSVFFVSEESPMNHDSAIVIQADGHTLLDLNDARLFPVQFRGIRQEVGGDIDVFAFQGAGASWFPMCYPYPSDRQGQLSHQKRLAKFAYAASAMRVVEPVTALPFAGPPCFLDPELFQHNHEMDTGIFPDQEQVADWLAGQGIENTVVLLPGDAWDVAARMKDSDPVWNGFSLAERTAYLEAYAKLRRPQIDEILGLHPEPRDSLWEPFQDYFRRLLEMSPYFNGRIGMRVGFDITGQGGGQWAVDFRPGSEGVWDEMGECGYTYRFASRWLPSLLSGATPWEDFFLSMRFEAWRDPDVYNDHLLGLLKFAEPEALEAVEEFETSMDSDERITIHAEGKSYSIGRYCPHAGNDLSSTAEILPGGIVRCLAHHYEFELETGRCVNGNCSPLDVEVLESVHSEHEPQMHGSVDPRGQRKAP